MNEKLIRTFLCFPVPLEVRSKKNMLYSTLEGSPAQINWVKNDNLHLTLKFIGYTNESYICLLYTSPSPRDATLSRMPSSA